MLRLLRQYLPIRKALLVFSETGFLWLVVGMAGTAHLWQPTQAVYRALAFESLSPHTAKVRCIVSALCVAVISQLAIAFNELYDFRVSSSPYDRAARFVGSMGSAIGLSVLAVVLADLWDLKRVLDFPGLSLLQKVQVLVFSLLVGFALLYSWRGVYHNLLRRARFNERVLILGSGKAAHVLAKEMRLHEAAGYDVAGILPEAPLQDSGAPGQVAVAETGTEDLVLAGLVLTDAGVLRTGPTGEPDGPAPLPELVRRMGIDQVVVALADRRHHLPTEELLECRLAGIPVRDYERIFEQVTGKIAVEALKPSYLIFNEGFARHPWADLLKRTSDGALALAGLALTWPVMLVTALAIRMDSAGPILFSQQRVGQDGKPFTLFKFRSMHPDAEQHTGPVWATADDPRITRVGRFLRAARIDELPQLFNVLVGNMSLVGPRPERQHFVDELAREIPYFRQRHTVKPGITGWAQINYPYGNTVEDALQKLQFDLFYIKYQSFLFDLSILFNTIKTILLRKGT